MAKFAGLLRFSEIDKLVAIQNALRPYLLDAEFVDPSTFHVTLFVGDGDIENVHNRYEDARLSAFSVLIDGISQFRTPDDRYAIYFNVRYNQELVQFQRDAFYSVFKGGDMVSTFSIPENYIPHITLAYSDTPIDYIPIEPPFALAVTALDISNESYETEASHTMKSNIRLEKSISYDNDGNLVVPMIVTPFKGPIDGKRDRTGVDFFHEKTDTGPLNTIMVNYDHGKDTSYLFHELKELGYSSDEAKALIDKVSFGKRHIGVAHKKEVTPDGIVYDIIVNRNAKHFGALVKAFENGLLFASGGATAREDDPNVKGKIDYFALNHVAISPTPYNEMARPLLKSFLEELTVEENKQQEPMDNAAANPSTPIADAVREAVQQVEKSETGESPLLKSIENLLDAKFQAFETRLQAVEGKSGEIEKSVTDFATDMRTALPELAKLIAGALKGEVSQAVEKSKLELGAENAAREKAKTQLVKGANGRPSANWPGAN